MPSGLKSWLVIYVLSSRTGASSRGGLGLPSPAHLYPVLRKAQYITVSSRCRLPGVRERRAADPQDRAPAPGAGGGKSWAPFSGLCQAWGGNVHKAPARPGTLAVSPGANEGGQERTRVPSEDAGLAPESFPRGSDSLYFVTGSEPTRVITCCLTSSGVRKWGKKGQAG